MSSTFPPVVDHSAQQTMDLERDFVLQNYARYPLVLARGKGLLRLRSGRPPLPGFHRWHRRQCAGTRPSADCRGDSRAGRAADPHFEPVLQPVSGTAGQAPGGNQRPPAHVLRQYRHGGHGRRAQDGARPRPRHPSREVRDPLAGEFVSRTHPGGAFHHRTAQVPAAISNR